MKENKTLLETVTQLEKEGCQAWLQLSTDFADNDWYDLEDFQPQHSSSNKIQVTSFGNFQDVFIQIDGISILLDPLGTDLLEGNSHHYHAHYWEHIRARDELHRFCLDAVVLSTCLYSCTAKTVKKIVEKSPGVKWLTPAERKDWLVGVGVNETSIIEFAALEEKDISFGRTNITFICTKTNINSTSVHRKKCNSCGWIIKGSHRTFYSSGITNYHENDFKMVAEMYSPIHLALFPICYDERWWENVRNMSCMSEFTLTSQEVVKMHADVGSQQSLGLTWNYRSSLFFGPFRMEGELERELRKLHLDPNSFYFLRPGETHESK